MGWSRGAAGLDTRLVWFQQSLCFGSNIVMGMKVPFSLLFIHWEHMGILEIFSLLEKEMEQVPK